MTMAMKKKMRFPMLALLLLGATFVVGGIAGMFVYATGSQVIMEVRMAMVSHTEYRYSEPGQIVARITDYQGTPVSVVNCTATILYPDKTTFVSGALMSPSTIAGDYYYNFTTPAGPEGVYEYQATCIYNPGSKTASVTNSFHLSSAFSTIQTNFSQVQSQLSGLYTAIENNNTALANQIAQNISAVMGQQVAINSSLTDLINSLNFSTSVTVNITNNVTVNVNLTEILDAVNALNASMTAQFANTNGLITSVNDSMTTQFGVVNNKLDALNVTAQSMVAALAEINTTTQNTYTYITGTLATNVNNILSELGVMNATLNRVETVANTINSTTTQILQNQQDAIQMTVFSG